MNRIETIKILGTIQSIYDSFKIISDEDPKIDIWHKLLEDTDYAIVGKALQQHLLSNTYPPTPAHIRENVTNILKGERRTGAEAWAIFRRYINIYSTKEDYEKLKADFPDVYIIVRDIGGRELLMGNTEFIRPQVIKVYDENAKSIHNKNLLPESYHKDIVRIRGAIYAQLNASSEM